MSRAIQEMLEELVSAYARGNPLVLLFDYDGTLTPIVEHPRLATLSSDTRRALAKLSGRTKVHVGVLSGRALEDVKAMLDLPGLLLSGTGGVELELGGVRTAPPLAAGALNLLRDLAPELERSLAAYPGAWLEDKRYAWTVHYRQTPAALHEALRANVEKILDPHHGRLHVLPGPMAIEILAAPGCNKGEAVRSILKHLGLREAKIFYAGDNANDADAFEAVGALAGVSVAVGVDAPPGAAYRLPDPAALQVFLERLAAALDSTRLRAATRCWIPPPRRRMD